MRSGRRLVLLYALALLPRLGLLGDAWARHEISVRNFYSDRHGALWPPFLHFFFDGVWAFFGQSAPLSLLFYALVSSLVSVLVFCLAEALQLSGRRAWIAALTAAFYPYYVSVVVHQPDVGITIVLMAACCLAFARATFAPSFLSCVLCAAASILLVTDRSNALSLIFYLAALMFLVHRARFRETRRFIFFISIFGLLLLGYSALRWAAYGHFTPFAQNGGYTLSLGHNPYTGEYLRHCYHSAPVDEIRENLKKNTRFYDLATHDPRNERALIRKSVDYARSHPSETAVNLFLKAARYWDIRLEDADEQPRWKNYAYAVPYALLMILGAAGTARLASNGKSFVVFFCGAGSCLTLFSGS